MLFFFLSSCGYHKPEIKVLPKAETHQDRLLFIAIDGIGFEMMKELKKEGYFKEFQNPVPLIVTFPSATTTAFTGIFKPLKAKKTHGYESRFFSFEENRVVGGTPFDIYKYPVEYKQYFDSFRHSMLEKGLMYSFPGVAGKQDLMRAEKLALHSDKKVLMAYLGGTDGAQHLLGKTRMKRFMKYVDQFLVRLKKRYVAANRKEPLKIILFSDHGFHFDRLKTISSGDIEKELQKGGFKVKKSLQDKNDVVLVEYGLLSAGVVMTGPKNREPVSRLMAGVKGIDLVFWPDHHRIYMINSKGEEAYFEYQGKKRYRYISVQGDPLQLLPVLSKQGISPHAWMDDQQWFAITSHHYYPDPGYRLYTAFYDLVKNPASVLFSVKPSYQFGGLAALVGTYLKFGHKGTHGGFFWEPSAGMVMTDDRDIDLPSAIRYDQFFRIFLPQESSH